MPHGGDDLSCPLVDIVVTGVWVVFVVVVLYFGQFVGDSPSEEIDPSYFFLFRDGGGDVRVSCK